MPRRPIQSEVADQVREELVQAILEEIDRNYTTAGPTGPTAQLAEFFRALDESTLRAIAHRHGVFEEELEVDREERPDQPES